MTRSPSRPFDGEIDQTPPRDPAGAPATFAALSEAIMARRASLPKRMLQVATYVVDNPGDVAFSTAAEVAQALKVQPSTLVRFAQSFRYSGFSDLQAVFRDYVRGRWPDYRERLQGLHRETPSPAPLLAGFAQASIRSIERLTTGLAADRIEQAIDILSQADTIYLIASRRAFPVAAYLHYALGRLGLRRVLIDNAAGIGAETLAFAGPRDVAIAISFTPYTVTTVEFAAQAQKNGVPVLAITDSAFSPLVPLATLWLEVVEADHASFRSLAATMTLAMTLAAGTADRRASRSSD